MKQIKPFWQRFNLCKNQAHLLWLLLGIVSFIGSIVGITLAVIERGHKDGVQGTIVRIDTSSTSGSGSAKGSVRVVWGFDSHNNVLGSSSLDTSINSGSCKTIQIQQNLNSTAAARYVDVIAGDEEICVSAMFTTFTDGSTWHWYGDVGAACGQAWEYGSREYTAPNGTHFKAKCVWMSAAEVQGTGIGKPEPITLKQMKIDVMAYGHNLARTKLKTTPSSTVAQRSSATRFKVQLPVCLCLYRLRWQMMGQETGYLNPSPVLLGGRGPWSKGMDELNSGWQMGG